MLNGEESIEEMGNKLFEYIIDVASGKNVAKADLLHQDDFIPWRRRVSL